MKSKVILSNGFWSLLSYILWRGSLTVAVIILARSLSPEAFAAYNYFYLTASMLAVYAALGLGTTATKFFAESDRGSQNQNAVPLGTLLSSTLLLSFITFTIVAVTPGAWLSAGLDIPQWLLALGVAVMAFEAFPNGAISGIERYREAAIISAISGATLLLAISWSVNQQSHELAMLALVISTFIQAVGQLGVVGSTVGWWQITNGFRLRLFDLRRIYGFAGPMVLVSMLSVSGTWLVGKIILSGQGSEHAFSLYTIGLQWFALALVLPNMIARVILPRLVRMQYLDKNLQSDLVKNGALLATLAPLGVTLLMLLLGSWLMGLYGQQYTAGPWFLAAFTASAILLAPVNVFGNCILANNRQWIWLIIIAIGFFAMILTAYGFEVAGMDAWTGAIAKCFNALTLLGGSLYALRKLKLT